AQRDHPCRRGERHAVADLHVVLRRPATVDLDLAAADARVAAGDLLGVAAVGLGVVYADDVELRRARAPDLSGAVHGAEDREDVARRRLDAAHQPDPVDRALVERARRLPAGDD